MFYTNRRANVTDAPGVSWVHGTPIGIAESSDGGHVEIPEHSGDYLRRQGLHLLGAGGDRSQRRLSHVPLSGARDLQGLERAAGHSLPDQHQPAPVEVRVYAEARVGSGHRCLRPAVAGRYVADVVQHGVA